MLSYDTPGNGTVKTFNKGDQSHHDRICVADKDHLQSHIGQQTETKTPEAREDLETIR